MIMMAVIVLMVFIVAFATVAAITTAVYGLAAAVTSTATEYLLTNYATF